MVQGKVVGTNVKGFCRWFNTSKGYGFLVEDGKDADIFVHYSSIAEEGFKNLKEKQPVEFTLVETDKGLQASDVRKLSK